MQQPEHPVQLGHGLDPAGLDHRERGAHALVGRTEQLLRSGCLQHHAGHGVAHRVVQLAGQLEALSPHGIRRLGRLELATEPPGPSG